MNRIPFARRLPALAARGAAPPPSTFRNVHTAPTSSTTATMLLRAFASKASAPAGPPRPHPSSFPSQSPTERALNIPPAPPAPHAISPSPSPTIPSPAKGVADPDPWDATRTTLQAFWSRYGNYVYAYLVWSVVGSLALNVLWTRQEREEMEDTSMVKIRRLERELKAIEDQVAAKQIAQGQTLAHGSGTKDEGKRRARAWYLPWSWLYASPVSSATPALGMADDASPDLVDGKVELANSVIKVPDTPLAASVESNAKKATAPPATRSAPEQSDSLLSSLSSRPSSESTTNRRPRSQVTLY